MIQIGLDHVELIKVGQWRTAKGPLRYRHMTFIQSRNRAKIGDF